MKVAVTGAEGFVGSWLLPALVESGAEVHALVRRGGTVPAAVYDAARTVDEIELTVPQSLQVFERLDCEAVVHLAAVASGRDARKDAVTAWKVNTIGTALVAQALADASDGSQGPRLLVVSTAEVYGNGPQRALTEDDVTAPCSPYGASKLGGEIAALEVWRRRGLPVMIVRSFPHTGPGQDTRFVVPAFARRILEAKRADSSEVRVGNLDPVRDILHVADVVRAYIAILDNGVPGSVYNVASGTGHSLADVFRMLTDLVGYPAVPVADDGLVRDGDIQYLVGDASRLRQVTRWKPTRPLRDTLADVLDAQTH